MIDKALFPIRILLIVIVTILFSILVIIAMAILGKNVFFAFSRLWSKILLLICGIKVRVDKIIQQASKPPYIVVANHSSLFDIPVLLAYLPFNTAIIYKKELEKIPIFGLGLKLSPFIGINRSDGRDSLSGINHAIDKISLGISAIVFPEGTRSLDGKLGEFKRGAFMIAGRSQKALIPIGVIGTSQILKNKSFVINSGIVELKCNGIIEPLIEVNKKTEAELMQKVYQDIHFFLA